MMTQHQSATRNPQLDGTVLKVDSVAAASQEFYQRAKLRMEIFLGVDPAKLLTAGDSIEPEHRGGYTLITDGQVTEGSFHRWKIEDASFVILLQDSSGQVRGAYFTEESAKLFREARRKDWPVHVPLPGDSRGTTA